jgi:hypothetical protein
MEKEEIIRFLERKMGGSDSRSRSRSRGRDREVSYNISGTSRHPDRERDYEDEKRSYRDSRDYEDYEDSRDYHQYKHLRLSKSDMNRWKQMMHNVDGTHGEHYDIEQTMHAAEKLGIRFDSYNEKEFCLAMNMIYSDYGHVVRKYCPPDKELIVCAELAKAFLDDPDGPEPSEKLALYFHCIADNN